ncbi:MAG: CRISPR-associated protein Cas4 [Acidobacteriota bacterium]|jgi:CRISPR-associated exonuclease Cas4
MFAEDELLPLSGLQHMIFCDRQAALIHLERIWMDNALTVDGEHLHRVVDAGTAELRGDLVVWRGMALRSSRLGLTGKADVVEFHRIGGGGNGGGTVLAGLAGLWRPFPVEYKRGRPKAHRADEVQLCAQAMCLEEMFDVAAPAGALFYGRTRRRQDVELIDELRDITEKTATEFHALIRSRRTPLRFREPKCARCSLLPTCLPPKRRQASARAYVTRALKDAMDPAEEP